MPGLGVSTNDGGIGFDYRLAMAIPSNVLYLFLVDQTIKRMS